MPKLMMKFLREHATKLILLGGLVLAGAYISVSSPSRAQFQERPILPMPYQSRLGGQTSTYLESALPGAFTRADDEGLRAKAVLDFYAARSHLPYWMNEVGMYRRGEMLIDELRNSWTHGLNPASYHLDKIENLRDSQSRLQRAELELWLTKAYLKYSRDLSGMRFEPALVKVGPGNWRKPKSYEYLLERLQAQIKLTDIIASLLPESTTYKKLRAALIALEKNRAIMGQSFQYLIFDGLLRPGYAHNNVPDLRRRFGLAAPQGNAYLYDDVLAASVMAFQRNEYLKPDGVIGPQTLQALNRSPEAQRRQLIVNLERLRWMDKPQADRYVLVNIPSATLWALDKGRVALQMPVIVGMAARPTLSFTAEIRGVRVNPTWTIPTTIKREDIWPQLIEDPSVIIGKGIEIYDGYGRDAPTVDPMKIKWGEMNWQELRNYRMVQSPGNHNPLGRFRVLMPNDYNIYLHDTNRPDKFSALSRDLSSGCVRMYDPVAMTDFILAEDKEWNAQKRTEILETLKLTNIYLPEPIPVYLLYYTAWLDKNGDITYGNDIYGWDAAVMAAIQAVDGIAVSGHYIPDNNVADTL